MPTIWDSIVRKLFLHLDRAFFILQPFPELNLSHSSQEFFHSSDSHEFHKRSKHISSGEVTNVERRESEDKGAF